MLANFRHYVWVTVALTAMGLTATAQKFSVTGTVADGRQPLMGATLRVLTADSSFVAGSTTDKTGHFSIGLERGGSYLLETSFVGYLTDFRTVELTHDVRTREMGTIGLEQNAYQLKETEVTAQKVLMVVRGDTLVYNADALKVEEGSTLDALLRRIPGMKVDKGKITVNGKAVSRILVNGKDFFGTDMNRALDNLPVYMIDQLKAYKKEDETNKRTGIDNGSREEVIDIGLKKKYLGSWLGTVGGGLGTHGSYVGQGFANRFDDRNRISLYASANNIKQSLMANENGDWDDTDESSGLFNAQDFGTDITSSSQRPDSVRGWWDVRGNVSFESRNSSSESQSYTQTSYPTTTTYENSRSGSHAHSARVNSYFSLQWKPADHTWVQISPNLWYSYDRSRSSDKNAQWQSDPYTLGDNPLDSLFGAAGNRYEQLAINSVASEMLSMEKNVNFGTSVYVVQRVIDKDSRISVQANANTSRNSNDSYSLDDYRYFRSTAAKPEKLMNVYDHAPDNSTNVSASMQFNRHFKNSIDLGVSGGFSRSYSEHTKDHYRLDTLGGAWASLATTRLRRLPSTADSLAMAKEWRNSYYQTDSKTTQHYYCTFNYRPTKALTVYVQASLRPYVERLDYDRDHRHYHKSFTDTKLEPNAMLRWETDSAGMFSCMYGMSKTTPSLISMLTIYDDSDPLNVSKGNPNLKSYYAHYVSADWNFTDKKMRSWSASVSCNKTSGNFANVVDYNTDTGVSTQWNENVDGGYSMYGNMSLTAPLDKNNVWTVFTSLNGSVDHSVGMASTQGTSSVRYVMRNRSLSSSSTMNFRKNDFSVDVNSNIEYNHQGSDYDAYKNTDTGSWTYGINVQMPLPWRLKFDTSCNSGHYWGFASALTNSRYIWNASVSHAFLKGKTLVVKLVAHDILAQAADQSGYANANMVVTRHDNIISRYFMCNCIWRLQSKR